MTSTERVASGAGGTTVATPAGPRTTVPRRTARTGPPPAPRQVGVLRAGDLLSLVGALVAALCTTALLWTQIGLFSGIVGYVVVTWCLFVAFYAALVSMGESGPAGRDRVPPVVRQ